MSNILGLDLGTNSIGWAVVNTEDKRQFRLVDKGVRIFQESVKIEKGVEGSKAAERTEYRSARRIKFRRKLRKIETLKVLVQARLCPLLSDDVLRSWRCKRIYPQNESFRHWLLTDSDNNLDVRKSQRNNPYYYRYLAASEKLNLSDENNRFLLGRAFYHMAQRRGFLSDAEIKNIVDDTIRQIVADARKQEKVLLKEIDELNKKLKKAEENEEPALKAEIE